MPRSAGLFESPDARALDWSGLYDEHAPRLHRIAARRVGADHANDVVQDIFIRAYRNRHAIDRSRPVGAWLSTIALRASTDALRRRAARPEVLLDSDDVAAAVGGDVDAEFENAVRRQGIKAAFDSLSERQQRVFRRLAIDGWSQEEVAADEGISTEAVKSLFARARRTFKETYEAFAERMGVFGGAAVGSAVWRLRTRLQRFYALVGENVGAITATAATVTVVAIATVPTTRAVPTSAAEPPASAATPVAAEAPARPAVTSVVAAVSTESPLTPSGTSINEPAPLPVPPSTPPNEALDVRATMTAGSHGNGAAAHVYTEDRFDDTGSRTLLFVEIENCDHSVVSRTECEAIDVATGEND